MIYLQAQDSNNGDQQMDEEILQDFIVEAGEIIENLNEQLVQIEKHRMIKIF